MMKKFIFGILTGLLLTSLLVAMSMLLLWPQYSDYRSAAETNEWMAAIKYEDENIIAAIRDGNTEADVFKKLNNLKYPPKIFLSNSRVLILKGGRDGQVLVLIPNTEDNIKNIFCIGGSNNAMPLNCRSSQLNILH